MTCRPKTWTRLGLVAAAGLAAGACTYDGYGPIPTATAATMAAITASVGTGVIAATGASAGSAVTEAVAAAVAAARRNPSPTWPFEADTPGGPS